MARILGSWLQGLCSFSTLLACGNPIRLAYQRPRLRRDAFHPLIVTTLEFRIAHLPTRSWLQMDGVDRLRLRQGRLARIRTAASLSVALLLVFRARRQLLSHL